MSNRTPMLRLTSEGDVKAATAARLSYGSPLLTEEIILTPEEDSLRLAFGDGDQSEVTLYQVHLRLRKGGFANPEALINNWKVNQWVIPV